MDAEAKKRRKPSAVVIVFAVLAALIVLFFLFSIFVLNMDGNEMLFAYWYGYDPYKLSATVDEAWMLGKTKEEINERYETYDSFIIFRYHHDRWFVVDLPTYDENGICTGFVRQIGPEGG